MKDGDSVHIIVVDQDSWVVRGFRCGAKQKCIGIDYKSSSSSEISPNTKNRWASLFSVVKVLKMGKKRVELKRIQNPSSRHATFSKRKSGLLKKAFELSVLCDAEVALIIFSETSKIYEFASNNDMTTILGKYRIHEESSEMSVTTSLQNSKIHDQSGFNKLQEKFNILQKKQKNMAGEDLELLTMKELQRLEKQLQSGVKKICDRKMRIFSQNSKLLMQKVRSLEEENKKLHTELSTKGDSSTSALENASVHQTNLHLGLNAGPSKPCEGTGDGDHSHIVETDISNS